MFKEEKKEGMTGFQTEESIQEFNKKFNVPYGKPYADGDENRIYSKHCFVTTDVARKKGQNNNVMVIGGSDFDKSVNIMLPNLLQMHGSYVVVDADGIMMTTTKKMFKENGYEVKVFDLNNVLHSNHYNPFMYIRDEDDVKIMASSLTENTEDDLWENTKEALLQAIIFYLVRYKEKDDQTLTMLAKLLKLAKTDLPDTYSQLDKIFDEVRVNNKDDICVKKYDEFKLASSKTTHAIITYLADKFRNFDDEKIEVGSLTSRDDMEFEKIGDRKTIVYIVLPTGNTQNGPAVQDFPHMFIVRTMLTQMSSVLFRHVAEDCKELKLNHDICFMLDAFINIGYIPNFYVTLSGMKKNDLSSMIFIPSIRRLRNHDEEYWDCFIESCDALVYLGGESQTSTECLNSENAKCPEKLLAVSEQFKTMENDHCIVMIAGEKPFYDKKYFAFEHPRAEQLDTKKWRLSARGGDIYGNAS